MEPNKELRKQIFDIIANQMKANDPPETKLTYMRLVKMGYSESEAKQLIGQCVSVELFNVIKHGEPYNEKRYIKHLKGLPAEPFD